MFTLQNKLLFLLISSQYIDLIPIRNKNNNKLIIFKARFKLI